MMVKRFLASVACIAMVSCAPSITRIRYREINNTPLVSKPNIVYTDLGLDRKCYLGTMVINKSIWGSTSPRSSFSNRINKEEIKRVFQKFVLKEVEDECYRVNAPIAYVNLNKIKIDSAPMLLFFRVSDINANVDLYASSYPAPDTVAQDSTGPVK